MSREKCLWVTGMISKHIRGKNVKYDVSELVAELIEHVEGGYRCKLCNHTSQLNLLILHMRRSHCDEIVEFWDRVRPARLFSSPGGKPVYMKIAVQCKECGYIQLFEPHSNHGPPNIKQYLTELRGLGALRRCPRCGRTFDLSVATLKFMSEREVLGLEG